MFVCEYCDAQFDKKYVMKRHQKEAKYCLQIQQKQCKVNGECIYCKELIPADHDLMTHYAVCEDYPSEIKFMLLQKDYQLLKTRLKDKDNQLKSMKEHIEKLEGTIERLSNRAIDKPTTNNTTHSKTTNKNTLIQNLVPLTDEYMREQAKFLTLEHILDGPEGYARFAVEGPFKDRVICTDLSRKKVRYKNEEGEVRTESDDLVTRFFKCIEEENKKLLDKAFAKDLKKVNNITDYRGINLENLTNFMGSCTGISNTRRNCVEIADGQTNEFKEKFIKCVIKLLSGK